MKYFTKEWQKQLSDAPENARTLAHETSIRYRAEQSKNPVPEEFERKLEFHDAQITSAVMDGNDLHLYFNHPGYNPFEHNHIVFKNARIKTKEHELEGCYFIYYEIYRHFLGYEMHMLLWYHEKNKGFDYADLTVICEDILTDTVQREKKKNKKKKKSVIYWLFAAYVLLMLWLLFGQRMGVTSPGTYWDQISSRINLIPMHTITEFWNNLHGGGRSHAFINLAGNVVMFVPLGFFIPYVFRKADSFRHSMIYALITIVCIEIIQLVTLLGSLDVDDLILNMIGVVIGYLIYRLAARLLKGTTHE